MSDHALLWIIAVGVGITAIAAVSIGAFARDILEHLQERDAPAIDLAYDPGEIRRRLEEQGEPEPKTYPPVGWPTRFFLWPIVAVALLFVSGQVVVWLWGVITHPN